MFPQGGNFFFDKITLFLPPPFSHPPKIFPKRKKICDKFTLKKILPPSDKSSIKNFSPQNKFTLNFFLWHLSLDFGFGRYYTTEDLIVSFPGTPLYESPDTLLSKPYNDNASDIWAMGAIFYEMLTGKVLFSNVRTMVNTPENTPNNRSNLKQLSIKNQASI